MNEWDLLFSECPGGGFAYFYKSWKMLSLQNKGHICAEKKMDPIVWVFEKRSEFSFNAQWWYRCCAINVCTAPKNRADALRSSTSSLISFLCRLHHSGWRWKKGGRMDVSLMQRDVSYDRSKLNDPIIRFDTIARLASLPRPGRHFRSLC